MKNTEVWQTGMVDHPDRRVCWKREKEGRECHFLSGVNPRLFKAFKVESAIGVEAHSMLTPLSLTFPFGVP